MTTYARIGPVSVDVNNNVARAEQRHAIYKLFMHGYSEFHVAVGLFTIEQIADLANPWGYYVADILPTHDEYPEIALLTKRFR